MEAHKIIFFGINSKGIWFYLPITIIACCIILFLLDKERTKKETNEQFEENIKCRKPIVDNPYSNVLVTQNKIDLPACEYQYVKDDVNKYYKIGLYQNLNDFFDKKHLERQFYTMPITTIPNKQNKYGKEIKPIGKIKKGGNKNDVTTPQRKNFNMYVNSSYNLLISKE